MMKQKITKTFSILLFLLGIGVLQAQESFGATGGEATGSGTVNYTVGQVVYTTNTGVNGNVSQGIQHPFEIYSLGINNPKINISLAVYPNPTTSVLHLKVANSQGLSYQLYDLFGKLLEHKAISSLTTNIHTSSLPNATYFLKVVSEKRQIKTFKVIKY